MSVGDDFAFFDTKYGDYHVFYGRAVFRDSHEFIAHLIKDERCMDVLDGVWNFNIDQFKDMYKKFIPLLEEWEVETGKRQKRLKR